jgi:hypothetical protein
MIYVKSIDYGCLSKISYFLLPEKLGNVRYGLRCDLCYAVIANIMIGLCLLSEIKVITLLLNLIYKMFGECLNMRCCDVSDTAFYK